jgi:hypothetical protein
MGCEKRVFRNNQIRFDTLPDNKSWCRSQKTGCRFGLRTAVTELQQEVEVLQLPLETFGIAEGRSRAQIRPARP